jgi:Cortactin-binding protein-2
MSNKSESVANHVSDAQLESGTSKSMFPEDIQTIKAKNPKVDFSKPELLKLLCYMEGELQARDIVIAVLKVGWIGYRADFAKLVLIEFSLKF